MTAKKGYAKMCKLPLLSVMVGALALAGCSDDLLIPDFNNPSLEELQDHCQGRLAGFKRPRRLELVDALPRTAATGQVQRTLLVEHLATR